MAIRNTEPAARSVALAMAALWAAACGTPGTPPSGSAQPEIVQDLFPDPARYAPRAETTLTVKVLTGDLAYEGPLTLRICHLDQVVHEQSRTLSLRARTEVTEQFTWTAPAKDFSGFLAVASAGASARTTGIDVSSSPYRFPRYGLLSDFSSAVSPEQRADRVRVLARRYLIDLLQFYDWQWRHEKLLPEVEDGSFQETWTDLFGREVVWEGVQQYVDAAHQVGAAARAALAGARPRSGRGRALGRVRAARARVLGHGRRSNAPTRGGRIEGGAAMSADSFHAARDQLEPERLGSYESRKAAFGPMTVSFERMPAGFPPYGPELYEGLPQRACQVPHMGYVFSGRMLFTHVDGSEQEVGPGDAYYVPPGHHWKCLEDTEIVEFSPTDELDRHMRVVVQNLERLSPDHHS